MMRLCRSRTWLSWSAGAVSLWFISSRASPVCWYSSSQPLFEPAGGPLGQQRLLGGGRRLLYGRLQVAGQPAVLLQQPPVLGEQS